MDTRAIDPRGTALALGISRGKVALLHGGPPCQPFSQIGKQVGIADPRGQLVFEMVRFAKDLRPTAVLMEQVPKFLDSPAASDMNMIDVLRQEFSALGYDLHEAIMDAADYGVAQRRKRAIIVCVPQGQAFVFPGAVVRRPVTVGAAISDLPAAVRPDAIPIVPNHVDVTPARDRYRISFVPEGQWLSKMQDAPPDVVQSLTAKDSTKFRRLHRDLPSLTLRCGEALYHPLENRYLTPRESARIQGFSDRHVFLGPIRRRTGSVRNLDPHRQVANAVPPPLARAVASGLRKNWCL